MFTKHYRIIFLLILLGFYLIFNTSIEPDFDNKDRIVGLVFCAIFIVAPFFLTLVLFLKKQKEMKGYKKCLLSKYGNVYVKRIFKSKIVEGDMNTTGSIRYKYVFSFVVFH